MHRRSFLAALPGALAVALPQTPDGAGAALPNRPKVPGSLSLRARSREQAAGGVRVSERVLRWEVAQTAIVICDMWDTHTCSLSAQRVGAMAPHMNQVVSAARSLGVMVIHSPSDTMRFYEGTPFRRRMQSAPAFPGAPVIVACPRDPAEQREFPIDDTAGGCDDPVVKKWTGSYPWTREHPAIDIVGFDGISENGQEIYN